ncbi:MAG TPA: SdrD B-like domain-containing protein, partial [Thermoguttaceae bacterium]|nr:SdrD B-like domain-containing protein [Thermoguttaceae bacterium]
MSLWKKGFRRLGRRGQKSVSAEQSAQRQTEHICQIEALEPRRLLAFSVVPIHLGMVYGEYATQDDFTGNRFELTWDGGQPGTQLTELVINADKDGQGLSPGDCFFDIAEGGRGVYGWKGFEILENQGIDQVSVQVEDGGAVLRLSFAGFDPGDRLVFLIDVDEAGYWDGTAYHDNSKAEGAEFEGSWLTATFTAPHYYQATASSQFVDQYGTLLAGSGLSLPQDDLLPGKPDSSADLTAGGFLQLQQTPLPITLAGRVYEDANMNNSIDSGELGIAGVQLSLWRKEGDAYVDTGLRATTDALGYYRFEATSEVSLDPGVYRIVQTQPDGYLSVGAQPGHVGAETRGLAESPNVLTEIQLLGGDQSQENNFGEVRPASICGRIFADMNLDGAWQPGEPRLAGVTVQLLDADGHLLQTTATNSDGQYCFTGLLPGVYSVRELQPAGYLDGPDQVGSVGGYIVLPDTLAGIQLVSGAHGVEYNFSEILPGRLSGYVFQDGPTLVLEHGQPVPPIESVRDGQFTPDDTPLAGVSVQLWRDGILVAETTTDANGFFEFAMLQPGNYTLRQVQPAGYVDGIDTAGSLGGLADSHSDTISAISIAPG